MTTSSLYIPLKTLLVVGGRADGCSGIGGAGVGNCLKELVGGSFILISAKKTTTPPNPKPSNLCWLVDDLELGE